MSRYGVRLTFDAVQHDATPNGDVVTSPAMDFEINWPGNVPYELFAIAEKAGIEMQQKLLEAANKYAEMKRPMDPGRKA